MADPPELLQGARFGLVLNQASVDGELRLACDLLAARFPGQLAALLTPQHGMWGEQQANMVETRHHHYARLDLPLYSLYSETRSPTPEMLRDLELLVIDLQDVGTRVYTFAWTVAACLRACAAHNIPLLLLDRPNPIGGMVVEGPLLDPRYTSFVGGAEIPMRHGLTLGELAAYVNQSLQIRAQLEVVRVRGWQRSDLWTDGSRCWLPPSPNMPRPETALLYPGMVLMEGTNLSEGRGTAFPFELIGAPFLEPEALVAEAERFPHPGLRLRPTRFLPTSDKWGGASCGGVAIHITDPHRVRSYASGLALLAAAARLAPDQFEWLPPPYEYERVHWPIDILAGGSAVRELIDATRGGQIQPADVEALACPPGDDWWRSCASHLPS